MSRDTLAEIADQSAANIAAAQSKKAELSVANKAVQHSGEKMPYSNSLQMAARLPHCARYWVWRLRHSIDGLTEAARRAALPTHAHAREQHRV